MPLRIQAGDGGHPQGTVGARTARGDHSLVATGHCIRLHAIVPTVVRKVADVVVVPYVFALWLVLPVLAIADNVKATSWTAEMVGWELLGAALDELLPLHEGDAALTPSVLRASLRKIADKLRPTATNLLVDSADMYEVYDGATPTDTWIAGRVDFLFELSYSMLLDSEGLLSVVAYLEVAVAPRYLPAVAHAQHGSLVKLGLVLQRNLPGEGDRAILFDHLQPDEMAAEVGVVLTRALPQHDFVVDHHVESPPAPNHFVARDSSWALGQLLGLPAACGGRRRADSHDCSAQHDSGTSILTHRSWMG